MNKVKALFVVPPDSPGAGGSHHTGRRSSERSHGSRRRRRRDRSHDRWARVGVRAVVLPCCTSAACGLTRVHALCVALCGFSAAVVGDHGPGPDVMWTKWCVSLPCSASLPRHATVVTCARGHVRRCARACSRDGTTMLVHSSGPFCASRPSGVLLQGLAARLHAKVAAAEPVWQQRPTAHARVQHEAPARGVTRSQGHSRPAAPHAMRVFFRSPSLACSRRAEGSEQLSTVGIGGTRAGVRSSRLRVGLAT